MVTKIISGGQTGVDQMGLKVAKELGIPTGGTAAKRYMTELGPYLSLREQYGLVECDVAGYPARTEKNVMDSDMTLIFGNSYSDGSQLTIRMCNKYKKPYKINPNSAELAHVIGNLNVHTLNVAGNRGSRVETKELLEYGNILREALRANS